MKRNPSFVFNIAGIVRLKKFRLTFLIDNLTVEQVAIEKLSFSRDMILNIITITLGRFLINTLRPLPDFLRIEHTPSLMRKWLHLRLHILIELSKLINRSCPVLQRRFLIVNNKFLIIVNMFTNKYATFSFCHAEALILILFCQFTVYWILKIKR